MIIRKILKPNSEKREFKEKFESVKKIKKELFKGQKEKILKFEKGGFTYSV